MIDVEQIQCYVSSMFNGIVRNSTYHRKLHPACTRKTSSTSTISRCGYVIQKLGQTLENICFVAMDFIDPGKKRQNLHKDIDGLVDMLRKYVMLGVSTER